MYRLDWIERLKLSRTSRGGGSVGSRISNVSGVVWALGLTSFLTDISAEMVNSILPAYLFLHLRLSPLQFGAIDGIYNGLSIALVSLFAGFTADRWKRHKDVALFGYGLSAVCKLLLLVVGAAWGWISLIVGVDRLGKGVRTAPRDSIISLHTADSSLGTAFGVHRALDSAGALAGPLIAFALFAQVGEQFDVLWLTSFVIGVLGVAALWLFVPATHGAALPTDPADDPSRALVSRRFIGLASLGTLLALLTVSDGFLYLLLQEKSQTAAGFLPLFYVGTAAAYMLFSIPMGLLADRYGRRAIFIGGYVVLVLLYGTLITSDTISVSMLVACLALLGMYYAGTEGVLMALASTLAPRARRTTALAIVATCVGVGKLLSSLLFGWVWQEQGAGTAILAFAVGGVSAVLIAAVWLRTWNHE